MSFSRSLGLCICGTIVACFAVYVHFNFTEWFDQLYFNGDNITLALVVKSLLDSQPFRWVFSSQTFLFPEAPLFIGSFLLSGNLKDALLTNAYLNLFLLGLPVFLISKKLTPKTQFGLLSTGFFYALVALSLLLETTPSINANTIFTPVLFATYYSGVIITALFVLLMLCALPQQTGVRRIIFCLTITVLGGLTYSSDPLYLLQVIAPLLLLSAILYALNPAHKKNYVTIFSLALSALMLGLIARHWTSAYAIASVGNYINAAKIIAAFAGLFEIIKNSTDNLWHALSWGFWGLLFLIHGIYTIRLLNKSNLTEKPNENLKLIHLFCFLSPLVTIAGVLLTGNFYTRYFLPLPLFTLVGFSLMLPYIISFRALGLGLITLLVITASFFGKSYISERHVPSATELDIQCFNSFANSHNLHPVGGYWTSRYLTLYGPSGHQVFQVLNDFTPFNWLSNTAEHSNTAINAVIVDREALPFHITQMDTKPLGNPDAVLACEQFDIYLYSAKSNGFIILNERIRR